MYVLYVYSIQNLEFKFCSIGDSVTNFWLAAIKHDGLHLDLTTLILQARGEFVPGQTKADWNFLQPTKLRSFVKEDERCGTLNSYSFGYKD